MSLGRQDHFLQIVLPTTVKDAEGFSTQVDEVVARVRAYREGRHGSTRWANLAAFTTATDLFRFRAIPSVEITTKMLIIDAGRRFEITSVENVKGRGMYIEVLCKEVTASGKGND